MRFGLVVVLVLSGLLVAACGSEDSERGSTGEAVTRTVEITREVTVVRTVEVEDDPAVGAGAVTRERLPGPAVPAGTETLELGETAELASGGRLTVLSGEAGVPEDEAVYRPREGMQFFVTEVEACVPESAAEPVLFTPREFGLLGSDGVRRIPTAPAKMPALRGAEVPPGSCTQGYVTFRIEDGAEPEAVVFRGSPAVRWDLDSG